jgi:hypothetical protein
MSTRMLRTGLMVLSTVASADALSQAPAYPAKPIRLVVPFAPGASNDTLSRATALVMAPMLGQMLVIDNRPRSRCDDRYRARCPRGTRRLHHPDRASEDRWKW